MIINNIISELPVHPTKKPKTRPLSKIKTIVVHCTDWVITPQALAEYDIGPNHISKTGCPSITYHYMIESNGTINRTAPDEWELWHAGNHNPTTLAVALVYKTDPLFEAGKKAQPDPSKVPSISAMGSLRDLLVKLCKDLEISPPSIQGHRELFGTGWIFVKEHKQLRKTCPGMAVNLDKLRSDVALALQTEMKELGLYNSKLDGIWGPKSENGFRVLVADKWMKS